MTVHAMHVCIEPTEVTETVLRKEVSKEKHDSVRDGKILNTATINLIIGTKSHLILWMEMNPYVSTVFKLGKGSISSTPAY